MAPYEPGLSASETRVSASETGGAAWKRLPRVSLALNPGYAGGAALTTRAQAPTSLRNRQERVIGSARQPAPAPRQRRQPGAAVRADRARLHADRRRDGDDQPRARVAVRARHVRGAGRHLAADGLVSGSAGRLPGAAARRALRPGAAARADARRRGRHADRARPASHLRQGPAVRPAVHLRRRAGDRGADPPGLGLHREAAAAAGGDLGRVPAGRTRSTPTTGSSPAASRC